MSKRIKEGKGFIERIVQAMCIWLPTLIQKSLACVKFSIQGPVPFGHAEHSEQDSWHFICCTGLSCT